ncbi:nitroreductase [Thermanaerothrix daxensis]|uniref:Nitroreductase n=1 Tax=Thermanaerothrix daxensis TaxID=869279 RepID=A0A0P6XG82_9CHLR|nr:SagB/ThcOx family dehydrogenase [Thermanaerothrix daxensis]KPL82440.1 nitroreductase [Thermanaerothrix daxensis]
MIPNEVFTALQLTQSVGETAQQQGHPQPPLEWPYDPQATLIPLPGVETLKPPPADLWQIMAQRRTLRHYADQPLTLEELALLLWATQGVRQVTKRPATLRTVPSAGARHAFETLLLVNRVSGLGKGVYRYLALRHALLPYETEANIAPRLYAACYEQEHILHSAVTFFWVAVTERMTWRYGARGLRYLFLDAGHVCQNLYLAAEGLGCGVCAIGAFDDTALNPALNLDGRTAFVIYGATVGKRAPRPEP